ncbi:MAG: alpha/beta fold hydrolase [Candidatus Lokiarchaeota archaeon]|nr:alpha/beta fold hydrolase [Candidatus Lokiarchaeota archaeon]
MTTNIIFVHGLESSGHGFKGNLFRKVIPDILTPDLEPYQQRVNLKKLFENRMAQLNDILNKKSKWILIGSSFGGLMSALYTCKNPAKIKGLILLAPLLAIPSLNPQNYPSINVPVIVYHGKNDSVVSWKLSKERAEELFEDIEYNIVDDDHKLERTVKSLDWLGLINKFES